MELNPPVETLRDWQLGQLNQELRELRDRVGRLETTLGRGVLLLIGNLAAVITSLVHQVVN